MIRYPPWSALFVLLCGCSTPENKSAEDRLSRGDLAPRDDTAAPTEEPAPVDVDGDGWPATDDCNDDDPTVYPGAVEVCNGVDDNCADGVDEGAGEAWFRDADGDGYGQDELGLACDMPEAGAVTTGGDCADDDPTIHPYSDTLVDGRDSSCDGKRDWKVTIYVAVDDAGELCVNDTVQGATGGWNNGAVYEIWLSSGTNSIGIYGWDLGRVITAAIAHLEISDGSVWVTDNTWRYDPDPDQYGIGKLGWCAAGFDDTAWDLALDVGPIGDPSNPWGNAPSLFPEGSPARWIWDHFPVDLNSQYLRTEFDLP